jgi:hypothetical protein
MQFGHRVKSVSLAEYKPEEVEQMRDGGNQVRQITQWLQLLVAPAICCFAGGMPSMLNLKFMAKHELHVVSSGGSIQVPCQIYT